MERHLAEVGVHSQSAVQDAFMFLSKLYRQMYAGTGISTDSARRKKSRPGPSGQRGSARTVPAKPMPELASPAWELGLSGLGQAAFAGSEGAEMSGPFIVISKEQ